MTFQSIRRHSTDIAVILLALASCGVVVARLLAHTEAINYSGFRETVMVGRYLHVADLNVHQSPGTLVIGINDACQGCSSYSYLYNDLMHAAVARNVHTVVISTTDLALQGFHLPKEVALLRHKPDEYGFILSPMIVWASTDGIIRGEWMGRITTTQMQQILAYLDLRQVKGPTIWGQVTDSWLSSTSVMLDLAVIDVRERSEFSTAHHSGAINIPLSELYLRAPHELDASDAILVDCGRASLNSCDFAITELVAEGFTSVAALNRGQSVAAGCRASIPMK